MMSPPHPAPQPEFAAALLDAARPVPAGLRAWNGSDPAVRFAVYRNNVVSSLVAALADTFPVVRELVGAAFFDTMARLFVARHPPQSPVLAEYGEDMPTFIERFEPAAALPYLADVARLERARVRAYHAADAPALAAQAIAAAMAAPEQLAGARLVLHPSLSVIGSAHAIVSLWAAHQGQGRIEDVDLNHGEAALVLREHDDAAVIRIAHASASFIALLLAGETLGPAAERAGLLATRSGEAFDLADTLSILIGHGALTAWHSPGDPA